MTESLCYVIDADGKPLSPTKEVKAWYMIRKGKAKLVNRVPMVIQINRTIPQEDVDSNEVRCGIDDGGSHVGIALVEKCKTKNKVLFKATLEQRNDVKLLLAKRKAYRQYHRYNKRHRKERYNNRLSSMRKGKIAPSILQKRQATMRVIKQLQKWVNISNYWLEDVAIDIRALTDGYKPYKWQYLKGYRIDENIRKAVILRDNCHCKECGKTNTRLEVHHIKPRRLHGSNTMGNLITLCSNCHQKTEGNEELYMSHYFEMLGTNDNKYLNSASHVMIGKHWLRAKLSECGELQLTNGGDTANKRIDWNIDKTHSNDAICITNLKPNNIDVKEWVLKPIRKKSRTKTKSVLGIKHRDLVEYTYTNGQTYRGYVTALYPKFNSLTFISPQKKCSKVSAKKCKLLCSNKNIHWLENTA